MVFEAGTDTTVIGGKNEARLPIFLRGIRVPHEWLGLPHCLLPAVIVAETGTVPDDLIEDDGAVLGWRVGDARTSCPIPPPDLDAAVDAMRAGLGLAGQETLWLEEDELVWRLLESFRRPEFSWDNPEGEGNFSDLERSGAAWQTQSSHPRRCASP